MQTTWIVAADSTRARIFEMDADQHLKEIDDLSNSASRMANREIDTDAYGRFSAKGQFQAHTDEPDVSAVKYADEQFSKQVSKYLEKARNEHRYDKLCVFAAPAFLGMIRQHLSKEVMKLVESESDKDISWFDLKEIEQYVQKNLH